MKRILKLLPLFLVISLFLTTSGFAKSDHAKKSLVALGDSIPFGYGLTESIDEPSRDAFPYLIGNEADLRVRNLAVPGWQTTDLLHALENNQKFIQAVHKADYITLNIGSNDLLKPISDAFAASGGDLDDATIIKLIGGLDNPAIPILQENTLLIIEKLYELNPNAKIALYNLYNPFLSFGRTHPINKLGDHLIRIVNQSLEELHSPHLIIANAYEIGLDPFNNLLPGDVHPSLAGHERLAQLGLQALGLD